MSLMDLMCPFELSDLSDQAIITCMSAWAFQSPPHVSSSNPQNMLTSTYGPISYLQILPMPRARGTHRTTD